VIRQRIVLASAAGLASALLLAACGSSNDNASSTSPGNAAPVATAASDPATSAPATSAPADSGSGDMATTTMLMAKAMKGMGNVVTDDKGMTLYRYDMDQATPSMSMCTGDCAKTWMPIMAQDSVQTMGVEKSLLGSVARSDGMKQLTLGGWPLYRYMGDTKAGQMNGQGKDKMWFAVTPSGKKSA
jgi:predicted lipoprotein with Yx(FWY)xxD motif